MGRNFKGHKVSNPDRLRDYSGYKVCNGPSYLQFSSTVHDGEPARPVDDFWKSIRADGNPCISFAASILASGGSSVEL